jgi:uncharacterized membrane-anchored protein
MPSYIFAPQTFLTLLIGAICLGIITYLFEGESQFSKGIVTAVGVPFILFILWSAVREWLNW